MSSIPLEELPKDSFDLTQVEEMDQLYDHNEDEDEDEAKIQDIIKEEPFKLTLHMKKILFVCWFGNFLCAIDGTIVSTTMSNIASDFNQSHLVTWIATSYLLTNTAFQPLYGKTSDILGRKFLMLFGQVTFALGILLSGLSINVETLSISRAIAGAGGAGMGALASIIITDIVPLSQRSIFVGYGYIVSGVAQMLGGPIGGICIETIGWRLMFLIQVPFIILIIAMLWKLEIKVDHIPHENDIFSKENLQRVDYGGIITLNLSVSSVIFLLSATQDSTTLYKGFFILLFIASTLAFIYVERYIAVEKIIDPNLLRGEIGLLGVTNGIASLGLYMILFITPLYLQILQGIPVVDVGFYTLFFVISNSLGSLISGYIIRKYDSSESETMKAGIRTSSYFFVFQTIGFAILFLNALLTQPESHNLLWKFFIVLGQVIAGLGNGGYGVGIIIYIIGKVGKKEQASANTVVSLVRSLGNVFGVSLSLTSYSKEVYRGLNAYFKDDSTKEYVQKLILDSNFIRNGLPSEFFGGVLEVYKGGLVFSFYPALSLSLIGLIVMFLLNRRISRR